MLRLHRLLKKTKNGLNSQKASTVRRKLFEMFLKIIDWKTIWKFCVKVICGSHFGRTSRISCEEYDEKCYDQCYHSILLNVYNY